MALFQESAGWQPRTGNARTDPMPLPKPHPDEKRDEFMSRCMADPATKEMQGTNEQKVAACERQFDDARKEVDATDENGMKVIGAFDVGDEAKGEVSAVIATLGEIDHDGEIIAPDAIPSGMKVIMSFYNHSAVKAQMLGTGAPDEPPVGKGAIYIEGNKAIFRGHYFLETARGKEAFLTTKAMGPDARWSFAYGIQKTARPSADMEAKGARRVLAKLGSLPGNAGMEVSPVNMPGGVGTQTLSIKAKAPTASVDGTEHSADDFAYRPDAEKPSTWKLPIFDADHVRNALARWNQTDMPDAAEKAKAKERLLAAARKFNVDAASLAPAKKDIAHEHRIDRVKKKIAGER